MYNNRTYVHIVRHAVSLVLHGEGKRKKGKRERVDQYAWFIAVVVLLKKVSVWRRKKNLQ